MWRRPHDPWNAYLYPPPGRISRLTYRLGLIATSIGYALLGVVGLIGFVIVVATIAGAVLSR